MRVAIVASPFYPVPPKKYGGTEQVIHYLIRGLNEAGHEPILLAPADSDVPCKLIPVCDESIGFPKTKQEITQHNKLQRTIFKRTEDSLRELMGSVDIIHSHGFDLINFQSFPNLTTVHVQAIFEELEYYKARKGLYFCSISKNQQLAFPKIKFVGVAYNGEDPSEFPLVTKPKDYVCFLGRFDRDKNPHLAIELAISLGIPIKLAGKIDFKGKEYFDSEVKKYLKHPLVEYLGEMGFDEKVDLLSNAKCNLHPTNFREPFGLTLIEAAYCGTPTLAINRGSMSELIEDGRTGVLVEDFIEGHQKLADCFDMDREYIAHRARMLFNFHAMTQQYVKAYEKVLLDFKTKAKISKDQVGKESSEFAYFISGGGSHF